MGERNPRDKKGIKRFLQFFFPLFLSFLLAVLPVTLQAVASAVNEESFPSTSQAVMDLSGKENFDFQNRFLQGDVEFFYNQWIVSEPEAEISPVSFSTPGNWTRRSYEGLGALTGTGYASYRYKIKGLKAGTVLFAFRNIEIPNRIYLNGTLCSSTGQATKDAQVTFIDLSDSFTDSIVVPSNGEVEYVMEVGNTGEGGASHIGSVYVEGRTIVDFSNRIIAPIALGFIIASLVTLTFFIALSENKRRTLPLIGLALGVGLLYFFSQDSMVIGLSLTYSAPTFYALTIVMYAALLIFLFLYGLFRKPAAMNLSETLILSIGTGLSALAFTFLLGSQFVWIPLILLASFPLYLFGRNFTAWAKGRGDPQFMILTAVALSFGLLIPFYGADLFRMPFVYHPTIFTIVMTGVIFAAGFRDIYMTAVTRRDFAVLERRYRSISNRALAHLASEAETIATLSMIGESYEESLQKGDRRLLGFSTLMRRRLVALRQDKISFAEESELESQLNDLRNLIHEQEVTLILDVEEGSMEVPPLIFETVLAELGPQLDVGELVVLWERNKSVGLSYPAHCEVAIETESSIAERCALLGLNARFRKGEISLSEGVRR